MTASYRDHAERHQDAEEECLCLLRQIIELGGDLRDYERDGTPLTNGFDNAHHLLAHCLDLAQRLEFSWAETMNKKCARILDRESNYD